MDTAGVEVPGSEIWGVESAGLDGMETPAVETESGSEVLSSSSPTVLVGAEPSVEGASVLGKGRLAGDVFRASVK